MSRVQWLTLGAAALVACSDPVSPTPPPADVPQDIAQDVPDVLSSDGASGDLGSVPDATKPDVTAVDVIDASDAGVMSDGSDVGDASDVVAARCVANTDCPGRVCDRLSGRCVDCLGQSDCTMGRVCSLNRCVDAVRCTTSRMCPGQGLRHRAGRLRRLQRRRRLLGRTGVPGKRVRRAAAHVPLVARVHAHRPRVQRDARAVRRVRRRQRLRDEPVLRGRLVVPGPGVRSRREHLYQCAHGAGV